jgi:uncharacterized protein YaiL (DUF2058 family)
MGNASLRDQLLKAGLVNEKQVKQAAKEKHKEALRQHGQVKIDTPDKDKQRSQREKEERIDRDRLLNQQRQMEAEKKALYAQVRQLVEQNRQPKGEGDTPFNFVDRGKVKRLYVSDSARQRIVAGQLAIVRLEKEYELVPAETAEKIHARIAECVVVFNTPKQPLTPEIKPDDPYAKFQVPDDLMW